VEGRNVRERMRGTPKKRGEGDRMNRSVARGNYRFSLTLYNAKKRTTGRNRRGESRKRKRGRLKGNPAGARPRAAQSAKSGGGRPSPQKKGRMRWLSRCKTMIPVRKPAEGTLHEK